jgi:hypothetical protein
MIKKLCISAALLCLSLSAGSLPGTKQYSIILNQPVQVGAVKLAPGEYKLKVDGANAIFINKQRKEFTAPVKVEALTKKTPVTAIETKEENGTSAITIIDIGGAEFKLVF